MKDTESIPIPNHLRIWSQHRQMRNWLPVAYLPPFHSAQDNLVQKEVQDAKLIKEPKIRQIL